MTPGWKIKREIKRIVQQVRGIPERLSDPVRAQLLNRKVQNGLPFFQGKQPLRDKVAVVLVYQPNGLSKTIDHLCGWLVEKGYSPLIVCNTPLTEGDKTRISTVVWRGILRPNFGYDFGGYRDALLTLRLWRVEPEHLLIVNDSVWLPTLPETDMVERGEAHPADIVGSIMRRRQNEKFLESYYFQVKGHVLKHPDFRRFWSDLQLTSNKYYVIRRGERGFTRAMLEAGFHVAALFDQTRLAGLSSEQDDAFLEKTLRYTGIVDPPILKERDALLDATDRDEAWRKAVVEFIDASLPKHQCYSSFPYASIRLLGYPFLKKSPDPTAVAWRDAYCRAVEANDIPAPPLAILDELKDRVVVEPVS